MPIKQSLLQSTQNHLTYSLGKRESAINVHDIRLALSLAVRDHMVEPWHNAIREGHEKKIKKVYYLSMEFLMGRLLEDGITNLGLQEEALNVAKHYDLELHDIFYNEPDAALGNGGLGRLASCFLDSMATVGTSAIGYGIRYENGLFRQEFEDGAQVEKPEEWLKDSHPWEFRRPEFRYAIGFGGHLTLENGKTIWKPADSVVATGFDTPIIGWQGKWANTLRLWESSSTEHLDLLDYNRGDHHAAMESENIARSISRVLYPDDTTPQGKELRFKQEYFFTAASIHDILRRFFSEHDDIRTLSDYVAIQLNDTHPAIAGPELIRILIDDHGIEFDEAFNIGVNTLSYTNHTLMPEALECWPEQLIATILPRHMDLIRQIDHHHKMAYPARPNSVSILGVNEVRMGNLAFIMAHKVNGVSALHTELVKKTVFHELNELHPKRIVNETNGITPRRWLVSANPKLSTLITDSVGDGWQDDLDKIKGLESHVDDAAFLETFHAIKHENKVALSNLVLEQMGIAINPNAMFDIQIKRIHEYKRQLLNIFETIALWHQIRSQPNKDFVPRVKFFGGKAAPGYFVAKEIIRLINDVAKVINNDSQTRDLLKVVYPPNYNVSMAEILIPAADLSEQISTAGTEASGTGNMKLSLNGALTIGTLDGANVEIREHVGAENFFLFGMTTEEVVACRRDYNHARNSIEDSTLLQVVLQLIAEGRFSPEDPYRYHGLVDRAWRHDHYLVTSDFASYEVAQREVDVAFLNQQEWTKKSALNTARMGYFSSDRTIRGYMHDIWDAPSALEVSR